MTTPQIQSSPLEFTTSPTISVLMPVYNAASFVAETIESILAQTFTDFELLITDDGSTDDSYRILESYAANDTRIRLKGYPNQGVPKTRNQMLQDARGEFIAVMDADDIALPDRFACQLEFLQQHPDVVCVGGAHWVIDEHGRLLTHLVLPQQNAEIQTLALAGHGSICHPCAMIRRSAMLQVGGYSEILASAHDLDLWLKLGEIGLLANLDVPVLKYRLHTGSVSGSNYLRQREEARQACEWAWQRRNIQGHFEATDPWRPGPDRASQLFFLLQYGWWAFQSGQRRTALIYGAKAVKLQPFAIAGWKLLAVAILKPLPGEP